MGKLSGVDAHPEDSLRARPFQAANSSTIREKPLSYGHRDNRSTVKIPMIQ
jgi:hypothetical protein